MTPERWRAVQAVFHAAADLDGPAREAALDAACAGDAALRAEAVSLLAADAAPAGLLDAPAPGDGARGPARGYGDDGADPMTGRRVGAYRIVRALGHGGMGAVYLARREEAFEHVVALKLARDDLAPALRARFELERQILADLAHPHVARLLDGGVTDDGQPFLVMEYVEGEPITAFCDARQLPPEARIRLFEQVCDAVHFAHTRLVVHRDLKPSNVLVAEDAEGRPVVKLLDFGIARLLDPGPGAVLTLPDQRLLTPAYASPEQVRGEPISTASDVYSLGVVLYELLTGRLPHAAASARGPAALYRSIAEDEPVRPSTAATRAPSGGSGDGRGDAGPGGDGSPATAEAAARARGLTPAGLRRRLAGDVDAILLHALRKEPARRYASALALRDDLARHLDGRPVLARRGTGRYRAEKFVRRHRAGVATAFAVAALLVGGVAFYTARVTHERDAARREADRAERVSNFLTDVLAMADPNRAGGAVAPAVLLDSAAARAALLAGHPDTEADVLLTLAAVFERVGQADRAAPLFEAALARKRRLHGDRHLDVTTLLVRLAEHHANGGRYAAAESLGHRALVLNEALVGPDHPYVAQALNVRAMGLQGLGRLAEADTALRRALAIARRDSSDGFNARSISLNNLARLARARGDAAATEAYTREALALRRRLFGPEHPEVANSLINLAAALGRQGRYAEAERLFREGLAMRARTQGPDHPEIGVDGAGLAGMLFDRGDRAGAEREWWRALAHLRRTLPPGAGSTTQVLFELAPLLASSGRAPEAEALFREALAGRLRALPPGHWQIAEAESRLGAHLAAHGAPAEAAALLRAAVRTLDATRGPADPYARDARRVLDSLQAARR